MYMLQSIYFIYLSDHFKSTMPKQVSYHEVYWVSNELFLFRTTLRQTQEHAQLKLTDDKGLDEDDPKMKIKLADKDGNHNCIGIVLAWALHFVLYHS